MISSAVYSDEFVGRREQLELLFDEFRAACDERARFVSIEGEAGIGKSRLVREFVSRLDGAAVVAFGECVEQIRRPYLPIEQVLERLGRRAGRPVVLEGRTHAEERAAYFQGVAETLRRESIRKPLVIVVEDVQWADAASVDLLAFLAGSLAGARTLVVVTLRTPGMLQNAPLSALRLSLSRVRGIAIGLRGLRRYDVKILVQKVARSHAVELPLPVIAKIESLCDGNPLFAQELTRIAIENGEAALDNTAPLSAQAMLSERFGTFSDEERAILIRAAIAGQTFEAHFVADICATTVDRVLATAQRALEHELVLTHRGAPYRFTFRHSLIRQVLADRLVPGLAAPLHLRIARAIENAPDGARRAAELAYHYSEARVAEKACEYNERAGDAAWDVYAYRDAIRFYSCALQWQYPPGPARASIYERLGKLFYIEGVGEEPAVWFERARGEHRAGGNAIGEAQALLLIAGQWWVDARTSESLRAAIEAAAGLEMLGETDLHLQAALSVARYAVTLGNAEQAAAQLRAIARSRVQLDAASNAELYEIRGEVRAALGDAKGALSDGALAVKSARQTGSSELIAQIENNVALVAADVGELDRAVEHHRNALAEARRTGLMWRVAYCALNYAQTLTWRGELDRARALLVEALECGVTTATFQTKAAAVGIPLSLAVNDRGLLDACARESALEYAYRSREVQRIASTGAAVAELLCAQGKTAEACDSLSATLSAVPHGHRSWNLWLQIALHGRTEDVALARTILGASKGRPRMLRAHALMLQAAALRDAGGDGAARLARLAERGFAAMGFRRHAAFCAELAGDCERALSAYRAMGAIGDAQRLAEPAPSKKTGELTPRQAQIADLVAQGAINREIAARLHISEHTVEHHLTCIFTRMGVKSRAQLIARWIGQGTQ